MEESKVPSSSKGFKFTPLMAFVIVIVIAVILLCLIIILGSYYFYTQYEESSSSNDQASEESDEDMNEEEVDNDTDNVATTTEFAGDYVTADLPEDWVITEYENGAGGYGILSDGVYSGLTAFTVTNPDGDVVFKLEGVNGIGGTGECSQVYQFADTEASYVLQKQNEAVALGNPVPPVTDLSGQDYIEFDLLGFEGRFVGNAVYWNVASSGSGNFNPACNMLQVAIDGTGLSFDYSYLGTNSTVDTYMPAVTSDFEYSDAEGLGTVLESIIVN